VSITPVVPELTILHSFPNPSINEVTIEFGALSSEDVQLRMIDSAGRKIQSLARIMSDKAIISRGNLSEGTYQVIVVTQDGRTGTVSLVFE
jgi:hypothetical protein